MKVSVMRELCWQLSAIVLILLGQPANAFTISPMSLKFSPSGGTQTIKVRNPSDQPVEMTVRIFSWTDSGDLSALEETDEIIAMPPVFEIAPNDEQTLRVALRRPLEIEQEKSYRVLLSEVPSEVQPGQGVGLNITVNMPIFVRPVGAKAEPIWSIDKDGASQPLLTLTNDGNAHLKLGEVQLVTDEEASAPLFEVAGGYVLGGDQRHWPLAAGLSGLKGPVIVKADSNVGPIKAVIALPDS